MSLGQSTNAQPSSGALPAPSAAQREHSDGLTELLARRIADQGWLSFADYMRSVLYEPGFGYYVSGNQKFGVGGDFTTAPETSDLFGNCIARQCQQVLESLQEPAAHVNRGLSGDSSAENPERSILEFGAGTGKLARAVLTTLANSHCLPDRYYILEPSSELRERQQALLSLLPEEVSGRVSWLERLPASFSGVVLANEVLDAMPVEIFSLQGSDVLQVGVGLKDGVLTSGFYPASASVREAVASIQRSPGISLADGYRSEVSLEVPGWIRSVSGMLERGALLLIDYGYTRREYYLPERDAGTLMCYYQQHAHSDPLWLPGAQDVTAHVDFTLVVETAIECGLELEGYTSQSAFLRANDLLEFASRAAAGDAIGDAASEGQAGTVSAQSLLVADQVKSLTLPGAMGERFAVAGFSRGLDITLRGFLLEDQSHRL